MARRRKPHVAPRKSAPRSTHYHCEALEDRTYFVVLHSGDVFEFYAENTHYERIVVGGNPGSTTVEFIGGRVNTQTNAFTITPMQGTLNGADFNGGFINSNANQQSGSGTQQQVSDTIYAVYITKSDSSTSIAVAGVPDLTAPSRPMQPFTNSVGSVRAFTTTGQRTVGAPQNTGNAYLGARTVNPPNVQNQDQIPILSPIIATNAAMSTPGNPSTIQGSLYTGPGVIMTPGNQIGQFLWGGTITGDVNMHGSVGLFYAGWLLTGNASGGITGSLPVPTRNFNVDGDIRNLLVDGSIGTDTDTPSKFPTGAGNVPESVPYSSGFDMFVGGRAGEIKTLDSFVGNLHVANSEPLSSFNNVPFQELENIGPTGFDPWDGFGTIATVNTLRQPAFGALPGFTDDTFNNPQYLGVINNNGDVVVNGLVQDEATNVDDSVDFYAVPLLAGQTVTVQLTTQIAQSLSGHVAQVGIFDPDGRLIATDYSRVDPSQATNAPFQFTASLPGAYRFAVTPDINPSFAAAHNDLIGDTAYTLQIGNVGNLGLGALVATNNILDQATSVEPVFTNPLGPTGLPMGIDVYNGDLGGVVAGWGNAAAISATDNQTGLIISLDLGAANSTTGTASSIGVAYSFAVDSGNLRVVSGAQIGRALPGNNPTTQNGEITGGTAYDGAPTPYVPHGSVGLLQATSQAPQDVLAWNNIVAAGQVLTTNESISASIGGDYQMVDAAQILAATLIAQGNIGSIRAANIVSDVPGYFQVNAANDPSRHGVIDLIDVSNQVGTIGAGGPAIVTGPSGDVRYFHCDTSLVFRDLFFGGGAPDLTTYLPGQSATITDDSGSIVTLSPVNAADQLTVLTYPVRGSGGAAIVRVQVSNLTNAATAGGLNLSGTGVGSAEIGTIELDGQGTNATIPAATPTGGTGKGTKFPGAGQPGGPPVAGNGGALTIPTAPTAPVLSGTVKPLAITFTGNVTLDTYEILGQTDTTINGASQSNANLVGGMGQVTSITNSTPGSEIVNLHLTSLGSLTTNGSLGLAAAHATLAAVSGNIRQRLTEDGTSGLPWNYPFSQPTIMVRVLGNIGSITAAGGVGNIFAGVVTMSGPEAQIAHLTITPEGTTTSPFITGGRNGTIGPITTGLIEGPIVAANGITSVSTRGVTSNGSGGVGSGLFTGGVIGPVTVNGVDRGASISDTGQTGLTINNGVLLQGVVANYSRFDFAESRAFSTAIPTFLNNPITRPRLDIGSITVNGNGGIIGSEFAANQLGPITVAKTGFGMFDSAIAMNGNGTIQGISAGGYGIRDGIIEGGASIGRISAVGDGSNISVLNFPSIVLQSMAGAKFDPVTGQPLNFLNDIALYLGATKTAPQIAGVTDSGVIEDFTELGSRDAAGVSAWSIRGRDLNSTTNILTSHGVFAINTTNINVANTVQSINVAGPVNGLSVTTGRGTLYKFGGSVGGLDMTVAGPIQNLVFNNSLLADSSINAIGPSGRIGNLTIHGNFNGTIRATTRIQHVVIDGNMVGTINANWLGYLQLGAGLGPGSLAIAGDVRQIVVPGSLSSPGNTLTVNGNLGSLKVGGNFNINLKVLGNMSQFMVNGNIIAGSTSTIAKTLNLLKVGGDLQAGATVQAHVIKRKIIKGQTLGSILQV